MPKIVKGNPLGFFNIHSVAKKNLKKEGGPLDILVNFGKKSHSAEKIERGDHLVSSGFVGFLEKVKTERGALCTKFPLARLGLRP